MTPVDRENPPEPSAIRPFDFPEVDRRELGNGLDLRVARMSRLPVVSTHLFLRAGESTLDEARAGLAVLAGFLVRERASANPMLTAALVAGRNLG